MSSPKDDLQEQPHGGALRKGGKPGNRGGTGRPRKEIRDDFASIADVEGRKLLRRILTADKRQKDPPSVDQQLRALEIACKFGIGTEQKHEITGAAGGAVQIHVIGPGSAPPTFPFPVPGS